MFNITILAVGKIKEKYYQAACDEYLKRLKPYAKINIHEIKAEPFGTGDKARAMAAEGERILSYLDNNKDSEVIILDERGKNLSSVEFSKKLEGSNKHFIFVIGGSLGLDQSVLIKPWSKMSLSSLVFPHEMVRVIILEQIYRAATIAKGKEYHH